MYHKFWRQFRQSPELIAVINIIATDILGDRPSFVDTDGSPLGRNKMLEAQRFWRSNRMKETLKAINYDMLVTGDGYGWIGKLSKAKRDKVVKEMPGLFADGLRFKDRLQLKAMLDEDLKLPKSFDYVASSTMQIQSSSFDIISYIQRANGIEVEFDPDEIVHYRWMTVDGKVEGFSPVEALVKELALLWFVKGNMVAYMENGGSPGKLFTVVNSEPGQPAFDRFVEQLEAFKDTHNRHGNYVGSGEIKVDDLDLKPKDLEYEQLALYVTSCIAFAFGIPVTRIPFLIGSAASGGDSGGMAESGYWNMISEKQDLNEDLFNGQVGDKLGWNIKFNRKYKQDEIREAQAFSMNTDSVTKMQSILMQAKKKLTPDKIRELLNLKDDDIEEMTQAELMTPMQQTGMMNQNLLDNNSVNKEPDNRKRADTKRNVANSSSNKGMSV